MSDPIDFPTKKSSLATYVYLPVTMQQFEDLTNDILTHINSLMQPHALEADYLAQVLMSAIHALPHTEGKVRKESLFEACINRVACHVTYHCVEEIQKRIKAKAAAGGGETATVPLEPTGEVPPQDLLPDEVHGVMPPAPDTIA